MTDDDGRSCARRSRTATVVRVETEDGTVALDLATVVFVRVAGSPHTIGFSGE